MGYDETTLDGPELRWSGLGIEGGDAILRAAGDECDGGNEKGL